MIRSSADDPDALGDLARQALQAGEELQALSVIEAEARKQSSSSLWQWVALLYRALDEHEAALTAFAEASRLDPANSSIAHGRARVAYEAGLDARQLYQRAWNLAPGNGDVLIGMTAARCAEGEPDFAIAQLETVLRNTVDWISGHRQLVQLKSYYGAASQAYRVLDEAIARSHSPSALWQLKFDMLAGAEDFGALVHAVEHATSAGGSASLCLAYEAIAASELGEVERATPLFARARTMELPELGVWRIRHLLRAGELQNAIACIDEELAGERRAEAWPYAAIAWRLMGDPRLEWLVGDGKFIRTIDLRASLPPLDELACVLRSMHERSGRFADQSVRGGTQTDGPLLSRVHPVLRATRAAIVSAIETYVADLPEPDPPHPLLSRARGRIRFSGSWSVRLLGGGAHANHVHPHGWVSSALHIVIPQIAESNQEDVGSLTFGQPDHCLALGLDVTEKVRPRPGHLTLFPSFMWHGTDRFAAGERLSLAFDVRRP